MTGSIFERILAADGIILPTAGGANKKILCWSHAEKTPSLNVNVVEGLYYCFGCGISGDALTYLTKIKGLSFPDAKAKLKEYGWHDEGILHMEKKDADRTRKRQGLPPTFKQVPAYYRNKSGTNTGEKIAEHDYRLADGTLIVKRVRFRPLDASYTNVPKIAPLTPKKNGEWWYCDPKNDALPDEDQYKGRYPLYRLPDLVKTLEKNPDGQIWLVEGEKCVDAVLATFKVPPACTTAIHRYTDPDRLEQIDWEPLRGKNIVLIADTDDPGRKYVRTLAPFLSSAYGCTAKMIVPKGEGGYDIADAIADQGPAGAVEWLKGLPVEEHTEDSFEIKQEDVAENLPKGAIIKTEHFQVLGLMAGKNIAIQCFATNETLTLSRKELSSETTLLMLAPLKWWKERCKGNFTSQVRLEVADRLNRGGEHLGFIDLSHLYGLGAIRHGSTVYYNMGNHVLTEDTDGLLTQRKTFQDVDLQFIPGPEIQVEADTRGRADAKALCDALLQYRFATTNEARAFLGWLATSLTGGALSFRPMLWLLGPKNVGKSFLLESVLDPILGNALRYMADPTAAGLAQFSGSAALPVCIDEFEPTENSQKAYEAILALGRASTSGHAKRIRGVAGGEAPSVLSLRFSLLVASIHQKNLSPADASRFMVITFGRPIDNWLEVRDAILAAATPAAGQRIRHYVITNTKKMIDHADRLEKSMLSQHHYDTRTAKILAALTAGAALLSGDDTLLTPTVEESKADTHGPLEHLLAAEIQTNYEGGLKIMPIGEALTLAYFDNGRWLIRDERTQGLVNACSSYGMRIGEGDGGKELRIAYNYTRLRSLLRHTPYYDLNLYQYFKDFPQAYLATTPSGTRRRIRFGASQQDYIAIPLIALGSIGFSPDYSDQELDLLYGDGENA